MHLLISFFLLIGCLIPILTVRAANADTVAEILRETWATPFAKAFGRLSWLYRFFGSKGVTGDNIRWKVHYAGNGGATSYGLTDNPPAADSQKYAEAKLEIKRNHITIAIDGLLKAMTQGAGGYMSAEASELSEALQDLIVELTRQMWLDGTGNSSKDMDGIANAISASGTYAGLARATRTWWQSYEQPAGAVTMSEAIAKAFLDEMLGNTTRKVAVEDFVVLMNRTDWRNLGNDIQANGGSRRLQTTQLQGGFSAIMVDDTPFVHAPGCVQGTSYGVSRSTFAYRVLLDFDVYALGKTRDSDEVVAKHYANLQCKLPHKNGKIIGLAAA